MFTYIYDWLWNFVCYMILITALLQVLPENSYQKYIRFFSSLILVLILASPIFRILGMEENFRQLYNNAEYRQIKKEIEAKERFIKEQEQDFWSEAEYEDAQKQKGLFVYPDLRSGACGGDDDRRVRAVFARVQPCEKREGSKPIGAGQPCD